MNSQDIRPDDRETLSALFDGELDADARLFAMRRLGHDESWQRACGQWQLIGDAMRRSAPIAAPGDFASRVATAVAAEVAPSPDVSGTSSLVAAPRTRVNARWVGGALAASVALAAMLSMLPSRQDATGEATPTVTSAPVRAGTTTAIAASPVLAPADVTAVPSAAPSAPAPAAVLAQTAPRSASIQPRARRASASVARDDGAPRGEVDDVTLLVGETGNPFNLDAGEALTARPWPRATLAGRPFTARFGGVGESAGERPSFYPFEPRPQGEAEPAKTP